MNESNIRKFGILKKWFIFKGLESNHRNRWLYTINCLILSIPIKAIEHKELPGDFCVNNFMLCCITKQLTQKMFYQSVNHICSQHSFSILNFVE